VVGVGGASGPATPPMSKKHLILIVDDDLDIREVLADALVEHGHTVLTASNGAEALTIMRRPPLPSLILLDLMMPVMNGYRFLEESQKDPALAFIPVVVLTAGRSVDAVKIEGRPVVQKPFGLPQLHSLIARY
jgi:CheY-like chemotaxis protein